MVIKRKSCGVYENTNNSLRFHYMRQAYWVFDKVRRKTQNEMDKKERIQSKHKRSKWDLDSIYFCVMDYDSMRGTTIFDKESIKLNFSLKEFSISIAFLTMHIL